MKCVHANTIYTGTSVVENGFVCFAGSRIAGITTKKAGTLVGEVEVVTPAFVDPHSHIGMLRAGEPGAEAEANERLDSILAVSDALDSVQMDDQGFADCVELGLLYACAMPGSGNIIGGRSAVIRTYAKNTSDALVARAGIKGAFGYNPMSTQAWKGERPSTRMGAMTILRRKLHDVREKMRRHQAARGKKKEEITFTAEELVLRDLLRGRERLRAHVHKIDDIAALLRLVDEFKLRITVEHACDVHQPEIFNELKRRRIPVVFGPLDSFSYKVELKHENWHNLRHLIASGVEFGLMSDHPVTQARQLYLQTRWLTRLGFTRQQAIEIVTRKNAEILGIERILGTLARGKWASFIGWNGDPFDMTRWPVAVFGEGQVRHAE